MLFSHDRLNFGDGFRGKGGPVLFAVRESELQCWKSHVNENTILAGGWCWNPFSTVPRISHTFTLFVLLSLHLNLFRWCRLHPVPHLAVSTLSFPPSSSPPLLISAADSHPSVSTSNGWSSTNVQRLFNSLFPTSLSSSHSSILCLFRDLG